MNKNYTHIHTQVLWAYEKESKGRTQYKNCKETNLQGEEMEEWYVEGHTGLHVGYFQGLDFNFELWCDGYLLQNGNKQILCHAYINDENVSWI